MEALPAGFFEAGDVKPLSFKSDRSTKIIQSKSNIIKNNLVKKTSVVLIIVALSRSSTKLELLVSIKYL